MIDTHCKWLEVPATMYREICVHNKIYLLPRWQDAVATKSCLPTLPENDVNPLGNSCHVRDTLKGGDNSHFFKSRHLIKCQRYFSRIRVQCCAVTCVTIV